MIKNVNIYYISIMLLSLLMSSFPLRRKHAPVHFSLCFKAALGLEWVERLKSVAKMKLEYICSKFSVFFPPFLLLLGTDQLRVGGTLFNTTVPHPQGLQTMVFLTHNGPQSCLLFSPTHCAIQKGYAYERIWLLVMLCSQETQILAKIHSVICTTTLW